jgi:hypothetical protein
MKAIRSTDRSGRHAKGASRAPVLAYEQRLLHETRWALSEASGFFEGTSAVQATMRKVARRLDELGIAYAVSGGMAVAAHGLQRFTRDVDVLVTQEGLQAVHNELEGLGYVPPFAGSKNLRDTQTGVRIDFLVAGQFPGDGKPKPVAFPDPAAVTTEIDGIKYLSLPCLIELKLASGMTSPDRVKDLGDVMELVKLLDLPRDFSEGLAPYVREKYLEIWQASRPPKRYLMLWRNKFLTADAKSVDEMAETLRRAAETLAAMRADGVTLDPEGRTGDDYAYLVTTDPDVARKHDMHEESEFMGEPEDEGDGEDGGEGELPNP